MCIFLCVHFGKCAICMVQDEHYQHKCRGSGPTRAQVGVGCNTQMQPCKGTDFNSGSCSLSSCIWLLHPSPIAGMCLYVVHQSLASAELINKYLLSIPSLYYNYTALMSSATNCSHTLHAAGVHTPCMHDCSHAWYRWITRTLPPGGDWHRCGTC